MTENGQNISGVGTEERKGHTSLRKKARDTGRVSLGHPVGQTGVYRPVSQGDAC